MTDQASEQASATADGQVEPGADLPRLGRDGSFWGMTVTQFLGAYNDNVFKQLILLLSLTAAATLGGDGRTDSPPGDVTSAETQTAKTQTAADAPETAADPPPRDLQGIAMAVFGGAFLVWSGYAGYLSERFSKRTVIVLSKVAEIGVMALGVIAFLTFRWTGLTGLLVVLFLMGSQSAFFGPGKYGILPEMLRRGDLSKANGIFLMTTFLAIIFGTALAGLVSDQLTGRLWLAGLGCVVIAVIGTLTSLLVRPVEPADAELKFETSTFWMTPDVRRLLLDDRPLLLALLASCMFWLVGGIVMPAVNALGKLQLGLNDTWTSALTASVGVGIAVGCLLAGLISGGQANFRVMRIGCWGILGCLVVMGLSDFQGRHLLAALSVTLVSSLSGGWPGGDADTVAVVGSWGSLIALIGLGVFTGMFAVPLQVFMQMRPPAGMKGRTIAAMNQANWVAIVASALLYMLFVELLELLQLPRSVTFLATAVLMLPVALFYDPKSSERPPSAAAAATSASGDPT